MRIKICGITQLEQALTIADLGATTLGFICVPSSPRYLPVNQLAHLSHHLPSSVERVGVFAQATVEEIKKIAQLGALTAIQLHGEESPQFCQELRQILPDLEIIKAFPIRSRASFSQITPYLQVVDTLLLDAYHPQLRGGTGLTVPWEILQDWSSPLPWFLAGGLKPENIAIALEQVQPHGIDLSSGVERSPGDKDLKKVAQLFEQLRRLQVINNRKKVDDESDLKTLL